jgi:hypothetical protein
VLATQPRGSPPAIWMSHPMGYGQSAGHRVVRQSPLRFTVTMQMRGMGQLSSGVPSQSSSRPLPQTSLDGPTAPSHAPHAVPPVLQRWVPARHTPRPISVEGPG